jgi:hypothetical protein
MEVLSSMSAFTSGQDQVVLTARAYNDAALAEGLMISNAEEVTVTIDHPGSMHADTFDGVEHKELYFHDGLLTVFRSGSGFYAQAEIPKEIEAAMDFALHELDIEAPLMDLIYRDPMAHLVSDASAVLYITDKVRIDGTDCHHIAIRYPEIDLQIWVEEGERSAPRRVVITDKWLGGAPRFSANLDWDTSPEIATGAFEFKPPAGSRNIGFADSASE